jgi:HEAT repeat protein
MRDLEFAPAVPVFVAALADGEGALAAVNLLRLGPGGAAALVAAMQNTNPAVRAHASSVAENMFAAAPDRPRLDEDEDFHYRALNPELVKLLPALLSDPDPEVRLHAVAAAWNSGNPAFFNRMLDLLRDDNNEVSDAALGYLKSQRDQVPNHILLFREMLKDTNANVQIAGLQLLLSISGLHIPREELLPLFSIPRMEAVGPAVAYLRAVANPHPSNRLDQENRYLSCEEAKPLLQNPLGMARMLGLRVLAINANNQSVALAIPLLKDPEPGIRFRAYNLLMDLTGQNFPAAPPEPWEKWWGQNQATFKVSISPEELRQKQIERARQRRRTEGSPPP